MVVEQLFRENWVEKRPFISFFLGILFTVLAFATSYLLFNGSDMRNFIGIGTIMLAVAISVPSINKLYEFEEEMETEKKLPFFHEHEEVLDFYIYFFIGVFVVFFFIALLAPDLAVGMGTLKPEYNAADSAALATQQYEKTLPALPAIEPSTVQQIFGIMKNNLFVMFIAFVLSLFYSGGSVFLILLNASVFASALAKIIMNDVASQAGVVLITSLSACHIGIMCFHMIPEVGAYLLAAIAGGVLSKALVREKFMSDRFKLVMKDSFILLGGSVFFLIVAGLIEILISKQLIKNSACLTSKFLIITVALILVAVAVILEFLRKKHISKSGYLADMKKRR